MIKPTASFARPRKVSGGVFLLRDNPFFGPNIKHLRGELSEF
jgi:hypothetical protein